MRGSRPATFGAIVLTLMFALSTACFASPGGSLGQPGAKAPGGCHGHDRPMSSPAHKCCVAAHQLPAATPVATVPISLDAVAGKVISGPSIVEPAVAITIPVPVLDTSPPRMTVLRI